MNMYPVDLDDCSKVGMWGGCGLTCFVYQEGRCEYHKEIENTLKNEEEKQVHAELYTV